jgi:hypothetical protein
VVTPSGSIATVLEVFPDLMEATVERRDDHERVRFRISLLRKVPFGYT